MAERAVRLTFFPLIAVFLMGLYTATRPGIARVLTGDMPGLLTFPDEISCSPWKRVSSGGFDLPTDFPNSPGFQGEEGFEVLVFKGQMYVGMEADNALGARLWRTRSGVVRPETQDDWEEVIADPNGLPWGVQDLRQVDHIDSLAAFQGEIYASTANGGTPSGTRVFRSSTGDPGTWEDALTQIGPGFGRPQNENFKDMIVFDRQLCGGTWNTDAGAEVWCTADGDTWSQANRSGFGDSQNSIIWSTHVFRDSLYAGVQHRAQEDRFSRLDDGRIYRARSLDDPAGWELVFEGQRRSGAAILLGDAGGRLYAATGSIDGIRIWSSETGDPGSWVAASRSGMSGSRLNTGTVTDGAAVYLGRLHVAVSNPFLGFRVWRLDEDERWRVVGQPADYDPDAWAAQLLPYHGDLYAWATNPEKGQSVWRTSCTYASLRSANQTRDLVSFSAALALGAVLLAGWRISAAGGTEAGIIRGRPREQP